MLSSGLKCIHLSFIFEIITMCSKYKNMFSRIKINLSFQVGSQSRELTELREIVKRRITADNHLRRNQPDSSPLLSPKELLPKKPLPNSESFEVHPSEHTNDQVPSSTFSEPLRSRSRSAKEVEEEPIQPQFKVKPERHY